MRSFLRLVTKSLLISGEMKFRFEYEAFIKIYNLRFPEDLDMDEGDVTNERLRYVLNMHKSAISELLKLMVKK